MHNSSATPSLPPIPSKREIVQALQPFASPSTARGLALTLAENAIYWGAMAMVIFAPSMLVKVMASIIAGLKLSAFFTLGHEATHRSLVSGKRLNWWIAQIFFLPAMQNYRLWVFEHHGLHHAKTNGDHVDFYTPYSKEDYDKLPAYKKLYERFVRAPNFIGFAVNFLCQRTLRGRLFPNKDIPKSLHKSAWLYFSAIFTYHAILFAALWNAPAVAPVSSGTALLLGFIVPTIVYMSTTGGSLYLMHTNAQIPWFKGELDRKGSAAGELCSTYLTLPRPVSNLIHNVFAHPAHHAHPGVPCYRLLEAQDKLDELMGPHLIKEPMTLAGAIRTMNQCKLYDFEKHQWLDFQGRPTAPPCITEKSA